MTDEEKAELAAWRKNLDGLATLVKALSGSHVEHINKFAQTFAAFGVKLVELEKRIVALEKGPDQRIILPR